MKFNIITSWKKLTILLGVPIVIGAKVYFNGGYGLFVPQIYVQYIINNKKQDDQSGKTILITGGSDGIGFETAKNLALQGAHIIIASRNLDKGKLAIDKINKLMKEKKGTQGNIEFMQLDLNDLNSVRQFLTNFQSKYSSIDTLINNAGAHFINSSSQQAFEKNFAVNHLAPFYLTLSLLPMIKNTPESRIINVASRSHLRVPNEFSFYLFPNVDAYFKKTTQEKFPFAMMTLYPISKLSNILFTNQLKKYLEKTGSKVKTYSLHPGVVRTAMADDLMNEFKWAKALIYGMFPFIWLTMKSPYYGAMTSIYVASSPSKFLQNGAYYADCQIKQTNKEAMDQMSQKFLWNKSLQLLEQEGFALSTPLQ